MAVASRSSATDPSRASLRLGKPGATSSWSDSRLRAIQLLQECRPSKAGVCSRLATTGANQNARSRRLPLALAKRLRPLYALAAGSVLGGVKGWLLSLVVLLLVLLGLPFSRSRRYVFSRPAL